jgi:PASTA domain/Glucodextranase, domain B
MRPLLLAGAACALLLSACGGGDHSTAVAPVRLAVSAPQDLATVRTDTVEIRGTVHPATSTVLVGGRRASVSGASWSAEVDLEPGVNLVDVLASAGAAKPALSAVRVRRLVEVEVPDIVDDAVDDARQALEDAGLKGNFEDTGGGFFDELLGGSPKVCETDPAAGESVDPGATVQVTVARRC